MQYCELADVALDCYMSREKAVSEDSSYFDGNNAERRDYHSASINVSIEERYTVLHAAVMRAMSGRIHPKAKGAPQDRRRRYLGTASSVRTLAANEAFMNTVMEQEAARGTRYSSY